MRTFGVVFFLLLAAGSAQAKFDPAHRWRTLRTAHFVVLFHEGGDELAGRAAQIAEEAHERLAPRVGWTPRERTRLIIADDADAAGGWASPYPYNQIMITPTPPLGEFGLGTTRHDGWLRLVITHEYTHVLQLDLAAKLPLALRGVFGRLYFPNLLQPAWLTEGLATFEETELTSGGRGRSPGSAMILRMAALEGPFPTLDQMAVLPDAWPAGQVPYLFGESFLRFLADRFGRERVAAVSRAYGGRALPFLVESTARDVLGEEYRELWRLWAEQTREQARELERAVTARGLTVATALTDDGRFNLAASWSPDGRTVAWLRADGRDYPGIWTMNADGSGRRRVADNAFSISSSGATLAWSPDGSRLFSTKQAIVRGAALLNDVWAWDFARGREIRITRGLRARDADPSPDGRALALVVAERGLTRLALLDLDGPLPAQTAARLRPLTPFTADQFAAPRWSPDGSRLAVGARLPGGGQEIRILSAEGAVLARFGHPGALCGSPAWSPDGRRLFFSSDATGIFNLHAWEARTGALSQVTNVVGGAFSPAPSPDGSRLAFTEYTARGYDLRVMDLPVTTALALTTDPQPRMPMALVTENEVPLLPSVPIVSGDRTPESGGSTAQSGRRGDAEGRSPSAERSEAHEEVPASLSRPAIRALAERDREHSEQVPAGDDDANGRVQGGPQRQDPAARTGTKPSSTPYSPLDTLLPRLWFPWVGSSPASGTLLGLVTGGQDVLQRHRYTLTGLYGPESGRLMHWLDYAYDGLRPTLRLSSADFDRTYAGLLRDERGRADYTERYRSFGLDVDLAFPGLASSQAITAGYRYRELSGLDSLPPWPGYRGVLPSTGSFGSTRLGWTFSNASRQPLAISPAGGRRVDLRLEHFQRGFGSEQTYTLASFDWSEYVALPPPRHVLAARLFVGVMDGGPPQQGVYALGGGTPGDVEYAVDDRALLLRGYPSNAFHGENALLGSLEYRFPLLEVGRGGVSAPLFLRRLHGALFVDAGEAWDGDAFRTGELHAGAGVEIRFDLLLSYYLPMTVRLGVAVGLDAEGGVYPTLSIRIPPGLPGAAGRQNRENLVLLGND